MSDNHVRTASRIFSFNYPSIAERGRTIAGTSIGARWRLEQDRQGIALRPERTGDLTISIDGYTFNKEICTLRTHHELFPNLNLLTNGKRKLEIREAIYLLIDSVKKERRCELAGIDALPFVLESRYNQGYEVRGYSHDLICLYPGATFIGEKGYLNVPCSQNKRVVQCPALHNPMRSEFAFLISTY